MADENLERWVRKKIESGASEEAVRKVLEKRGHDTSLVDNVSQQVNSVEEKRDNFGREEIDENSFNKDKNKAQAKEAVKSFESQKAAELEKSIDKKEVASYAVIFVLSAVIGSLGAHVLL